MNRKISRDYILNELKKITPLLSKKYGVTKLGVFGSVARDQASDESDVDIVFQISKPNLFVTVHIKEYLEQVLNMPVDLIRYRDSMNPYLKKRIDTEGIYV
jgi:uncharacterized protein